MVGTGYMDGKMILSKKALHHGFKNETDKKNTAIHEFVHLIDKMDGEIDGVPEVLLEKQYILPWLDLMDQKIKEINKGKSDINAYGGTSKIEFFTVASEYFFERPKLLSKKHPELYKLLEQIFKQDMINISLKKAN
jgi:Mlc titration factor MtfA (ptsG expression regulator)